MYKMMMMIGVESGLWGHGTFALCCDMAFFEDMRIPPKNLSSFK